MSPPAKPRGTPDPRFLIGRFEKPPAIDRAMRERFAQEIEEAPAAMRRAVAGLSDRQLDTPYRNSEVDGE